MGPILTTNANIDHQRLGARLGKLNQEENGVRQARKRIGTDDRNIRFVGDPINGTSPRRDTCHVGAMTGRVAGTTITGQDGCTIAEMAVTEVGGGMTIDGILIPNRNDPAVALSVTEGWMVNFDARVHKTQ
jgi:hypothetical protein